MASWIIKRINLGNYKYIINNHNIDNDALITSRNINELESIVQNAKRSDGSKADDDSSSSPFLRSLEHNVNESESSGSDELSDQTAESPGSAKRLTGNVKQGELLSAKSVIASLWSIITHQKEKEKIKLERIVAAEESKAEKMLQEIEQKKLDVEKHKEQIIEEAENRSEVEKRRLDAQMEVIQKSTKTSFKKLAPIHNYLRTKSKIYYIWHLNPYSSALHLGALIFFIATSILTIRFLYNPMLQKAYADAKTCTWKGTNSTSWNDSGNWSGCSSGVPGVEDYIVFDSTAANNLAMTSDHTVARVSSLDAGNFSRTFDTNGQTLTITETLTWQDGTLDADASEIKVGGDVDLMGTAGSGTFTYATSTLTLTGSASNFTPKSGLNLYALKIAKSTNSTAVTINTNDFNIRDDLIIAKGKLDGSGRTVSLTQDDCRYNIGDSTGGSATILFNAPSGEEQTGSQYLDGSGGVANDNVVINKTGGTLYYNGSATFKYLSLSGGTLNIQSGNLTFPASADGSSGKLSCAASKTLTIAGSTSRIISFRSSTPGSTWYFENTCGITAADYVDVKDSYNTNYATANIVATNSINSGNNTGWDFATSPLSTNNWISDTDSNWNNIANWSAGHVPTSGERAYFSTAHNGSCNIDTTVNVLGLIITDYTGTITQNSNPITIGTSGFVQNSGTFTGGDAAIGFSGDGSDLVIQGGSFTSTSGTMTFNSMARFIHTSGTFSHNNGTVTYTGTSSASFATIEVPNNGTFNNITINLGSNGYQLKINSDDTVTVLGVLNMVVGKLSTGTIDLNGTLSSSATFGGGDGKILINDGQTVNISDGWMLPSIDLQNGTLNAPSSGSMTFNNAESFIIGNNGTFNYNNGTITLIDSGDGPTIFTIDFPSSLEINNLVVNLANDAYNLAVATGDTLEVNGTLTLTEGSFRSGTIDLNGTLSGSATFGGGDGDILIDDGQTVNITDGWVLPGIDLQNGTLNAPTNDGTMIFANAADFTIGDNGTFNHNNGTVAFYWKNASSTTAIIDVQTTENFYNLSVDLPNNAYTLTVASGDTIIVNGILNLDVGKVSTGTIEAKGDVNLSGTFGGGTSPITFTGTGTQTMSVASGAVLPSGIITVNKASGSAIISGTSTILNDINLTSGTLDFAGGSSGGNTYTITANKTITTSAGTSLRFNGASGNLATLVSSTPGTRWNIADSGNVYANYVSVTDSNNSSGTIYALNTTQSNCVGWDTTSTAKTWDGGAGTLVWNGANNWSPDGVPDANDTVTLDVASTITTSADINFGSLTIGGANATTLQFTNNIGLGGNITITSTGTFEQKNKVTQTILGNVTIQSGGVITHTANGSSELYKLMLAVNGSMDVQSGGAISVNGKGYASAQGPGSGTDLSVGGTYGGRGKDNIKNSYGSLDNPVDLGSGGYNPAGTGGGAAILSVSGTLNVSGTISADGIGGICCTAPGYGSGGSVNISAGTLTGAGDVYAKGGQEYDTWLNAGGGGGRISFSGVENDNFTGEINANGSYVGDSHAGTIYLSPEKRSSWTITSGQTYRLGSDGTNNYTFNNITIENGGVLEIDSDPLMNSGSGGTATINASNVTIDTGGIFRADGLGFENGEGPGAGNDGMKGGTYGGRGYGNSDATYGSIDNPIHIGSSGTGGAEPGGKGPNGGGAISLSLSGALTINGTLSANGNAGRNTCASAGSGSGGSINIVAATLAGTTGSIEAEGGASGCNMGAGGGGRISLNGVVTDNYTGSISANSYYDNPDSFPLRGHAGTIYLNAAKRSSWTIASGQTYRLGSDGVNNYNFGDITVQSGGTLEIDGDEYLNSGNGGAATINAANISIDSGGYLKADGLGFVKAKGPGYSGTEYSGGSHGGVGGNGGASYGATSSPNPVYLGSGGNAGAGGGALILNISNTFTNAGTTSANGVGNVNGNGAGGTINIIASTFNCSSGTITANGGVKAGRGGGGGGRIVLRALSSYIGPPILTANGGAGTPAGTNGSAYINKTPSSAVISSPTNGSTNQSQVKAFTFNATDATNCSVDGGGAGTCTPSTADYLRYKLELADDSGFTTNNHTFVQGSDSGGQVVTDNGLTVVFSGQNAQSLTAYTSGTTATATVNSSTPLIQNHTYYIRISAIDPAGVDSFDGSAHYSTASSTVSFTVASIDKVVYTAGATQTIRATDTCSNIITFEIRNALNEAVAVGTNRQGTSTFALSDGGVSGGFYSDSACSTSIPGNQLTISDGFSSSSFYYKNITPSAASYSLTVSETASQGWTDAATTIQVNPGYLDHFGLSAYGAAAKTADDQFSITVTAYDALNNVKFDYAGSTAKIWFTATCSADLPYTASSKYTLTSGNQGIMTFSLLRLKVVGNQIISLHNDPYDNVNDLYQQGSSNTAAITISPGAVQHFDLSDYPRSLPPTYSKFAISGSDWGAAGNASEDFNMIVTIKDQFENIVTSYEGDIWFNLELANGSPADKDFQWDGSDASHKISYDPDVDHGVKQTNGIAGDYSNFISNSSGSNLDLIITNGTITTENTYAIYIKPLGLASFDIASSDSLTDGGVVNNQEVDAELGHDGTPVTITVTAKDTLSYTKVNYGYDVDDSEHLEGEGYIYFYSNERAAYNSSGELKTNQEFPYQKTNAADTTSCFPFPALSAGVHTFNLAENPELFQFFRGGRRNIYVSECIEPTSAYGVAKDKKDPRFSDLAWDSRANNVAIGSLPSNTTIAVKTHAPGSLHDDDSHTLSTSVIIAGPGDSKVSLNWKNPYDMPTSSDTNSRIYIEQANLDPDSGGSFVPITSVAYNNLPSQSFAITGLTNDSTYWYRLRSGFKKSESDNTIVYSDYSQVVSATPKALAPINVTAIQLDGDPENVVDDSNHPGEVKVTYQLRFDGTINFEYFDIEAFQADPAHPEDAWNVVSDSAVTGSKGVLSGNYDTPISYISYLEMNTDYDGMYRNADFNIRVRITDSEDNSATSEPDLGSFRLDTKNPANVSLIVNATNNSSADLTISADDDSLPMQMMLSNEETFNNIEWENYAISKTNYNINNASIIYLRIKDAYDNITTLHTQIASAPESFAIKDASNISDQEYRLVLIWKTVQNASHYNIWQSTDGTNYMQIKEVTDNGFLNINLSSEADYAYKVTSEDSSGNISQSAGPLSSTPGSAPDVTAEPRVELYGWRQDSGVRAKISWVTDQLADSNVAYSKGELNDNSDMTTTTSESVQIAANPQMINNHEILLQNLEPSTKYYFKAFSKNEIQIAGYSAVLSFTTPERVPLLIQGMKISDITMNSALVNWSTTKSSTTLLEYGNNSSSYNNFKNDKNFNLDHTFKLEHLENGTKYYLRVSNTDSDGNVTVSDVYNFETPAIPQISDVSVRETSANTATISWNTNVNCDSNIEFSSKSILTTNSEQEDSEMSQQGKADSTTIHSVTLIGLEPKTTYYFKAISKDQFGNAATSGSASFSTSSDAEAPKIMNFKSEVASTGSGDTIKYQAIISWDTDEPATSQVEFASGVGGDYTDKTQEIESLNSSHVVIIPDLKANSAYHFRIISKDKSGNTAYSDDISLITPPKEKSLLQVVIKSLEDTFSWVGRLREKWFGGK